MIYVIYPDVDVWNYVLTGIEGRADVCVRPLNRFCKNWQMVIRKLSTDKTIPACLLLNNTIREEIKGLKKGDSLLMCDYDSYNLFYAINGIINQDVHKYFWIWNPIKAERDDYYYSFFERIKKIGFKASTFDPANAQKFKISAFNQFFRMGNGNCDDNEILYDFYFIGFPKNREGIIHELEEKLSVDYSTKFKIVHSIKEYIPYTENVASVRHARCLIDLVQPGQSGLTLRPLEALAFHKKLISNNPTLIKYDFYHPQNIFILGVDNWEDIHAFMSSPLYPISSDVALKYDVLAWLNNYR